jgi:hypothetical protein
MGTEAPRWWRQLLDQLQVAAAEASAAAADSSAADASWQPGNLQAICDTIGNLHCLPDKLPKAVWKKVLALQVLDLTATKQKASVLPACLDEHEASHTAQNCTFYPVIHMLLLLLLHCRCLTSLSQCAVSSPTAGSSWPRP